MSLDLTDIKSTWVQVMAWSRQGISHCWSLCWPRSMLTQDLCRHMSLGHDELKVLICFQAPFTGCIWKIYLPEVKCDQVKINMQRQNRPRNDWSLTMHICTKVWSRFDHILSQNKHDALGCDGQLYRHGWTIPRGTVSFLITEEMADLREIFPQLHNSQDNIFV